MPLYEFACETTGDHVVVMYSIADAPSIGDHVTCRCPDLTVHSMRRIVDKGTHFAPVPGTPTNRIGMALEDRAELGRKRRAEWK